MTVLKYENIFSSMIKDTDIDEKFRCLAKAALVNNLLKKGSFEENKKEISALCTDILKSKKVRDIDYNFAKKVLSNNFHSILKENRL